METPEAILDGLEAALELERDLGVRTISFDRALLVSILAPPVSAPRAASPAPTAVVPQVAAAPIPETPRRRVPAPAKSRSTSPSPAASARAVSHFVFLHDVPLTAEGAEIIAKGLAALHVASSSAPIVWEGARPAAKIIIVLGARALAKWFPKTNASPGHWFKDSAGTPVLVTYSPHFFSRFPASSEVMKKKKKDMWTSLIGAKQLLETL